MSDLPREEVAALVTASEESLFETIALNEYAAVSGIPKRKRVELGGAWFNEQAARIREAICSNASIRSMIDSGSDTIDIVLMALPIVGEPHSSAISIACAIILILKKFGNRICESFDDS